MTATRSLRFSGPKHVECVTGSLPELPPDQIRVRTTRSLISPGSEVVLYEGTHTDIAAGRRAYPTSGGYSIVGVVEAVGDAVEDYGIGDRVMCYAGHTSCCNVPLDCVLPIPSGVSDDDAVFAVLGSIVLHGLREASPQFGENVLVMGMGAIGQIALRLLRLTPVRNVVVADPVELRLQKARDAGADAALNVCADEFASQAMEFVGERGYEIAIEASGNPQAVVQAMGLLAPRGRLIVIGCPHGEIPMDLYTPLQKRELSIIGSYQPLCPDQENVYTPWTKQRNRALILEYLAAGRVEFSSLITHRATSDDAMELYETLSQHRDQSLCGIFDWS